MELSAAVLPLCAVLVTTPAPNNLTTPIPKELTCMALRALCAGSGEKECVKKLNQRLDEHRAKREIGVPPEIVAPEDTQGTGGRRVKKQLGDYEALADFKSPVTTTPLLLKRMLQLSAAPTTPLTLQLASK